MAELVQYGIHQERVDIRVHVCVVVRRVYVYAAEMALQALENKAFNIAAARQNGVKTAEGYLVPPEDIPGCRAFELPAAYFSMSAIKSNMPTDEKGRRAAEIVYNGLRAGLIALPMRPRSIHDLTLQIEGVDIIADVSARIQVKCDYNGGSKALGGTGNLYIQIAELNPYKKH